ncbi:MAG: hypothetical protein P0Y53_19205 [Candidatus Pseudobacter hemicellulosilyticus]|uniref:Uncharacterized protein n=1 Tax=Candidatus Pseudobacter hemicellulosilyticus TaxID=3121375 RepID=A0AAJ5WUC9_9BACT|nr:MAG: hypothetical protein P0Y53_19205 [Pseudobacter sp.]
MLYNTSRKARLSSTGTFEKWLQANPAMARLAGGLLILAAFLLLPAKMGIGVGFLTAFLLLMTAASLVIIIAPMQYIRLRHIVLLVAGTFLLEYLFL